MENRFLGGIAASSFKNLFPNSKKQKMKNSARTRTKSNAENIPPLNPNMCFNDPPLMSSNSVQKKSPSKSVVVHKEIVRSEPRSDVSVQKLDDTPVKVLVRIRPPTVPASLDWNVKKVLEDSVSVDDKLFNFHSVLDSKSTQEDAFQLVGVPLVSDALAGYNTSVLAYGQTGSGKSYTMWGPQSAMVADGSSDSLQGIVPRIFQMLFSKIQQNQENSDGRQFNYQCRCSFLEIYNEQIGDLLDPTQRNLEIRDDPKNGFYVESLTEEYVISYEDVTQILIKGLSSRKVGTTSTNSKSSRSHIVFTCIIESWCKETSSTCFGSSKSSRITLVDLAGFERTILDDAGKQSFKEGKFVKKSTSQLGYLVNCLAEKSHSGNPEALPYQGSCLTQLLRESLGGNAKLSVICSISPDKKYGGETVSTLRFGQRARYIQNEPIINEITEDDVNGLTDQIRQLKEELIRAKSSVSDSDGSSHGNFKGRSVRESLNQLRLSINRSLILPYIDHDSDVVCADENDVKELQAQMDRLHSSHEEVCEADLASEQYVSCSDDEEMEEFNSEETDPQVSIPTEINDLEDAVQDSEENDHAIGTGMSIKTIPQLDVLQEPVISESPKMKNAHRRSLIASSNSLCFQDDALDTTRNSKSQQHSIRNSDRIRSSLRSSRVIPGPTESLAASLHRGLEIIDYHQRSSTLDRSSVSFSFEHLALKPCLTTDKAIVSEDGESSDTLTSSFLCTNCKQSGIASSPELMDSENGSTTVNEREKELERMCKELERTCKEHETKIEELNQLLMGYKSDQDQRSKEIRYEDEKCQSKSGENKIVIWSGVDSPDAEMIKEKCEVKEIQEEFGVRRSIQSFDTCEKESLLKEIESLRSKLHFQADISPNKSTDRLRTSLLAQSIQLRKSGTLPRVNTEEELEKERERWTEMESEWICLTDDLRVDLEAYRERAEKAEMELRLEKKSTEELDDVLKRSVLGHARMVEHYADLQEKYNELVGKHKSLLVGVAEIKRAAAKAGAKGGRHGSRFSKCLAAELSSLRLQKDKERELLRKENNSLKTQLRDTAEAVHAAGELLVRLREAEETASMSEGNLTRVQEENEDLKKQIEKMKRKHKMEMVTMKQYLAESRLPASALKPSSFQEDSYSSGGNDYSSSFAPNDDDDQAWRAEFGPIYQDQHY